VGQSGAPDVACTNGSSCTSGCV